MKFSQRTISLLKNFAQINQNILLREGSTIATISTGRNIFAVAPIAEEIPVETPIYDLNGLLALLTLNNDADVEFGETSLKINNGGAEFEFYYSDPSIIVAPPQKTIVVDEHYVFEFTKDDITLIQKSAAILSAPTLSIVSKNGVVSVIVGDPKTSGSNSYKKAVGEFDEDFNVELSIDAFKPIPDTYRAVLSKKKFLHLANEEHGQKYWYACAPTSVI